MRKVIFLGGDYKTTKDGLIFDVVEEHPAPMFRQHGFVRGNLLLLSNRLKTIQAYEWDVVDIKGGEG
jgi:hypothetical protein